MGVVRLKGAQVPPKTSMTPGWQGWATAMWEAWGVDDLTSD